jgi:hypothetical protein
MDVSSKSTPISDPKMVPFPMFRENIIKNTKNQPPPDTLKLGFLFGKQQCFPTNYFNKKTSSLLYLYPLSTSIFPHCRSSPLASNLASHPSTPPLPQIHHPTIAGLVLSPLPVGAWAFLGLTASVVTKTLSFSCAISAFTNQKQENEKLYIKQGKKNGTWVSFFSSFLAASAKHLLLTFSPSSFSLCVSGFLLGFFLGWFSTIFWVFRC